MSKQRARRSEAVDNDDDSVRRRRRRRRLASAPIAIAHESSARANFNCAPRSLARSLARARARVVTSRRLLLRVLDRARSGDRARARLGRSLLV